METKRIVITGMGTVNPLGNNVAETWKSVVAGKSGLARITHCDPEPFASKVAGEVKNFDYKEHYPESQLRNAKRMDPFVHYAMAATNEALAQANLPKDFDPYRYGMVIGSGIGGFSSHYTNAIGLHTRGARGINPFYIPAMLGNIASGLIAMEHGFKGPHLCTQTACATANHAFAVGQMIMQLGMADVIVAGGTESPVGELGVGGFSNMRALSTKYNDTPEVASRPYDVGRDGFVIAEGAGILVLETLEHAQARGATILAELAGIGMTNDAHDLVAPDPEGKGAYNSMKMAVDMAGITPSQINYINTHGTSTPLGDLAESKAISILLDRDESQVHVSSTKGLHGHLLGATAGLEAIITIEAMAHNLVPANKNLFEHDPKLPLKKETLPTSNVDKEITYALSNSFGFGGHNSTMVFKKYK